MTAPQSPQLLLQRCQDIAGLTLGQLAQQYQLSIPRNFLHAKGWVGQLLELVLGTTAGTKSAPDFEHLGIELKTLPLNQYGKPKETTYVCTVPLTHIVGLQWQQSKVYEKLKHVLWVPVEADKSIPIARRRIAMAVLWRPTTHQESILKQDWEQHMEQISLGRVESITAHQGEYLQIRPKAADSKAITKAIGPEGSLIETLPRGFYLRTQLTTEILQQSYL